MGLKWKKYFDSYPAILKKNTIKYDVEILDQDGGIVFEQKDVEVPAAWSKRAATIVASQYFRGRPGTEERETSFNQVVRRVVGQIRDWAILHENFESRDDLDNFCDDLWHVLWHQMASFNSPVWYNLGIDGEAQQGSACFIVDVEDNMSSITDRLTIESNIFRWGSGSGANNSKLRASIEQLSKGGKSSGPVSFMLIWDAAAEVIKSAGKRRAAKMEILDVDHPDIMKFIMSKGEQEELGAMIKQIAKSSAISATQVRHQNANHSVALSDDFMQSVEANDTWRLLGRLPTTVPEGATSGESPNLEMRRMIDDGRGDVLGVLPAKEIFRTIAQQAWKCGDPGVFFVDNINKWNTVPSWGKIVSSNPCAEFLQPPWSACNLASINLEKFIDRDDNLLKFKTSDFRHVVRTLITAMNTISLYADYPDERIAKNSRKYRPLGLGYSNLGASLIKLAKPYDSPQARAFAAAVTSLMSAEAWCMSSQLNAAEPYDRHTPDPDRFNRKDVVNVLYKHKEAAMRYDDNFIINGLSWSDIQVLWSIAINNAKDFGVANSQVTLLAPTGTISFMMDCETTGIEPLVMLGGIKRMADTGVMKFEVPRCVISYLSDVLQRDRFFSHDKDRLEWAIERDSLLQLKEYRVLDTALGGMGMNAISYEGHLQMMAAVQPFLSGSISKTVNVPESITPEQIEELYFWAWEMGLKSVAIYRDNSKFEQVYAKEEEVEEPEELTNGLRLKLPDTRAAMTHKFQIGEHKGYINVGLYPDGRPGEIFINMAKQGSTVRGLLDWGAILVSMCLQYGVPMEDLIRKFKGIKFEPQGMTRNKDILFAQSPVDYIFRWLEQEFEDKPEEFAADEEQPMIRVEADQSGPPCDACGGIMVRRGTCYYCDNCDTTTGCS